MKVTRRHHECILAAKVADVPGHVGDKLDASRNWQCTPFDEVILEIHDQ